ncbi:MAG: LON peptidase substrate-binding domain-containing protein [Candidatus Accumulibacter sp. UW20]|jgi:Lon protease-like protein
MNDADSATGSTADNGQASLELPLFPLGAVLFPGGVCSLKVFEPRYLDMVATCLRRQSPFGICLIASGSEVGQPAIPHPVGTLAHIAEVEVPQLGIMMLVVRGGRRFRIERQSRAAGGLLRAVVRVLDEAPARPLPPAQQALCSLLQKLAAEHKRSQLPEPQAFDDASWVGYRLTEMLPLQPLAKQKLLELEDPLLRLQALSIWLSQRTPTHRR